MNLLQHLLAGAALALVASSSHAQFTGLYVFGDSLSDSGNNALVIGANGSQVITGNGYIPTQPYGGGTYSNAGVWVTPFAAGLGLAAASAPSLAGGGNFAYGGARTTVNGSVGGFPPSATTQLNGYLSATSGSASATALYVIAVGGNDVRDALAAAAANPANAPPSIRAAAASFAAGIGNMVDALQAAGAQRIVVWDAPNVAAAPAVRAQGALAISVANSTVSAFNTALGGRLAGEAGVSIFDIAGLFNTVVANPGAYGFSNVTDACGAVSGCNPSQYLFWDGIHPTSAAQAITAHAMLAAVPEPASVLMMAVGVAGLLAMSRRRQTAISANA